MESNAEGAQSMIVEENVEESQQPQMVEETVEESQAIQPIEENMDSGRPMLKRLRAQYPFHADDIG